MPPLEMAALALTVTAVTAGAALAGVHLGFRPPRMTPFANPADFRLPHRAVRIPTAKGKSLFGWLLPGPAGAPAAVVMHGWGANADTLLPLAAPLARSGHTVLLVDARCHGRSDDDTYAAMPRFAEDMEAAMDWLAAQPDLAPCRLALIGHSVGAGAALLVASRRTDVAAVISLSAFDHPERVMRGMLARLRLPYRPLGWLVCRYVEWVIGHRFDAIAPVTTIAAIPCPVLIGHGAEDKVVPSACAAAIHARAAGNARLVILEGTSHERPASFETLARLVADFLMAACEKGARRRGETPPGRASRHERIRPDHHDAPARAPSLTLRKRRGCQSDRTGRPGVSTSAARAMAGASIP
ncbi:MAG: alpha/beta fold hydrolase [Magnetospirillum sp.]|nr:alpha/beta fold hydrolase [Magnetospirillum sp.]